jgi:hypothetical protein
MMTQQHIRRSSRIRPLLARARCTALAAGHAVDGVSSPMWRGGSARRHPRVMRQLFETFPDWEFNGQLLIDGERVAQPFSAGATLEGEFMGLPPTHRRCQISVRLYEMKDG